MAGPPGRFGPQDAPCSHGGTYPERATAIAATFQSCASNGPVFTAWCAPAPSPPTVRETSPTLREEVLARPREAEVDLARAGIRPARRDDLAARIELDPLGAVHVQVAEEARLPATEAVIGDRHRDRDVDPDHPGVHLELELPCRPTVTGEDRRPVAVRVLVDELDRV